MAKHARDRRGRRTSRIPIFSIFYSATYSAIYVLCLLFLAVTPFSTLFSAIQNDAFQYVFMIGGAYVLTAITAIVVYSSRIYSSRSTIAAVGKPYVPIEKGEVGSSVRKMIEKQLERSAIVAWESRPRDLYHEIIVAEDQGVLPPETRSVDRNNYTVGLIVSVDPEDPPWGDIQHDGWSTPSHRAGNRYPGVRFADVIAEIPNLIEARAVSLAPPDPSTVGDGAVPDSTVVDILRRPVNCGLRQYLTQLAYLNLIEPPAIAERFLAQYEKARFSGRPASQPEFTDLMATFSELISGMKSLHPEILRQIRLQTTDEDSTIVGVQPSPPIPDLPQIDTPPVLPAFEFGQDERSLSPTSAGYDTPRVQPARLPVMPPSTDSLSSVIHNMTDPITPVSDPAQERDSARSPSITSFPSDAGSMIHHSPPDANG